MWISHPPLRCGFGRAAGVPPPKPLKVKSAPLLRFDRPLRDTPVPDPWRRKSSLRLGQIFYDGANIQFHIYPNYFFHL